MSRNYIIINGVNSLTIPGLAIKTLPPITKPLMRTIKEEIDGRNGDINTELGYQAYDKKIEIGLFGSYDINQIIAFFNSSGTIVFSEEPDKYYNFKILDKIDFEKLIKFRSSLFNIHCQPFKYPLTDTPQEISYQYVEGTGEYLTLDHTSNNFMQIDLKGNTYQYSTKGKNLFSTNTATTTQNGITCKNNGDGTYTLNGTATSGVSIDFFPSETIPSGTYKVVGCPSGGSTTTYYLATRYDGVWGNKDTGNGTTITFTSFGKLSLSIASGVHFTNAILKPMITSDTSLTYNDFEQYTGGKPSPSPEYPQKIQVVSGDNSIEICGENLCDGIFRQGNQSNISTATAIMNKTNLKLKSGETYTISNDLGFSYKYAITLNKQQYPTNNANFYDSGWKTNNFTFTPNEDGYVAILVVKTDLSAITPNDIANNKFMLKKGTNTGQYHSYTGKTYPINLPVENIYDKDNANVLNAYFTASDTSIISNDVNRTIYVKCQPNTTYTISKLLGAVFNIGYTNVIPVIGTNVEGIISGTGKTGTYDGKTRVSNTIITSPTAQYLVARVVHTSLDGSNSMNILNSIQIEKGSKANTLTPFGTTPIELCKIDTYQDYIYKENDKWYLYKETGKTVLNGTENWTRTNTQYTNLYSASISFPLMKRLNTFDGDLYSNYFKEKNFQTQEEAITKSSQPLSYDALILRIGNDKATTNDELKVWLNDHNTIVYYVLAIPTNTEITYEPLIAQLNEIEKAVSYDSQTNITQENNDKPFIIYAKAIKKGTDTSDVNNIGNIYSKPILSLEGTGIVHIYKNSNEVFQVDLTDKNKITIDTEGMEAIETDTNILANRQVIGNYSSFKLEPGTSSIKFSGALTSATITKYVRWL